MRATRALLRRRNPLVRKRAEWLTHVQQTNRQYNVPEISQDIAYKTNRLGGAERCTDPAGHTRVEVDLAWIDYYDQRLRALELTIVQTAKQHDAHTLYWLQSVPGIGKSLSLVLLSESHDIARFPRVQDCVSYGRLVQCAKESAGKRYGTSGTKIGNAHLKWAFSEAAVLLLRNNPGGQKYLARLANKHGKGQALAILAHTLARAIYEMVKRRVAFDLDACLQGDRRRAGEPAASLGPHGWSLTLCSAIRRLVRRCTLLSTEARCPDPARLIGRLLALWFIERTSRLVTGGCPSPAPAPHWRTHVQPGVGIGRYEGTDMFLERRELYTCSL